MSRKAKLPTADWDGGQLLNMAAGTFVDHWILWTAITAWLLALWWFLTASVAIIFTNYFIFVGDGQWIVLIWFKREPSATDIWMSRR